MMRMHGEVPVDKPEGVVERRGDLVGGDERSVAGDEATSARARTRSASSISTVCETITRSGSSGRAAGGSAAGAAWEGEGRRGP